MSFRGKIIRRDDKKKVDVVDSTSVLLDALFKELDKCQFADQHRKAIMDSINDWNVLHTATALLKGELD